MNGNVRPDMARKILDARFNWHRAGILLLAFCAVNATGCTPLRVDPPDSENRSWETPLNALSRAPSAREAVPDSVEPVWTQDVGKSSSDALALGDSVILATAADRKITLIRRDNGNIVWQRRLKGIGSAGPLFNLSRVYSASGDREGRVHAHDFWTGKPRWTRMLGAVHRPIALRQSSVFAATTSGMVAALATDDGDIRWQRWLSSAVRSGVTVLGERVFVASEDSLYLLRVTDGTVAHAVPARGPTIQPPAIADDVLVLVSPEAFIAAYDAATLEERWWVPVTDPFFGGVAVARDTAFAVTVNGDLWRVPLDAPDGATAQSLDRPMRMTPAPVRNGVLLGTVGGEVLFVRDRTGGPAWSRFVDGPMEFPPVVDGGSIFIFDGRGTIHRWDAAPTSVEPADRDGV